MAENEAPATGAETTPADTGATTPATTTAQPDRYLEAATKLGLKSVDQLIEAAQLYMHARSPEGEQAIVDRVKAALGEQIAIEQLTADPDALLSKADSKLRRKVRRAVARRDAEGADDHEEGADGDVEPPAKGKNSEKEFEALRNEIDARLGATERAVSLAPKLHAIAAKDPRIANNFDPWAREVTTLLSSGHPKFQGEDGVAAASDLVLSRWRKMGEAAGLKPEAAPSPKRDGGQMVESPEEISKLVQKAMSQRRGRGTASRDDAFVEIRNAVFGKE